MTVRCAQCSLPLEVRTGAFVVTCQGCGERNLVLLRDARYGIEIKTSVSPDKAAEIVRRELESAGNVEAAFLDRVTRESEKALYFVPYYESSGLTVMRYKQKKFRERIVGRGLNYDSSPGRRVGVVSIVDEKSIHYDTRISIQTFHHAAIAVKGLRWGILTDMKEDVSMHMADLSSMQRRGVVLTPTLEMDVFQKQKDLLGTRNVETIRDPVFQDDRTVYRPVWRITTRYNGMVYEGFVCAAGGDLFKATAPQSRKSRATAFGISYAVAAFVTSGCIVAVREFWRMGRPDIESILETFDIAVFLLSIPVLGLIALMAAIAAYGWDKFRYYPEVIHTPDKTIVHAVGKYTDTWLDKLHKATLENVTRYLEGIFKNG